MPTTDADIRTDLNIGVAETLLHETAGSEQCSMGIWQR
jgi:hypothetical protein